MIRASWSTSVSTCALTTSRASAVELDVGGEELGVVEGLAALRLDEDVEPALAGARAPVPSRLRPPRAAAEMLREPALGDGVAKRRLAREVAVDAAVADAERAGDVDDVRLRRAVAAEDLLRRFEDPLGRERLGRHRAGP